MQVSPPLYLRFSRKPRYSLTVIPLTPVVGVVVVVLVVVTDAP